MADSQFRAEVIMGSTALFINMHNFERSNAFGSLTQQSALSTDHELGVGDGREIG